MLGPVEVATLDPVGHNASSWTYDFPVFGALVIDSRQSGQIEPSMAQSVSSSDGLTWTVKLRPNLRFTDGTALDASAVKFNWDRLADPANASPSLAAAKAMTATVVDSTTLKVVLSGTNGQWPRTLAGAFSAIGSPAAIQRDPSTFAQKPIGAGPFIVKDRVQNSQTTYVRNPNYFDAPRPYLDQLVVKPVADDTQRYNSFNANEADLMWTLSVDVTNQAKKDNHKMVLIPPYTAISLMVGVTMAPTDDVAVRTAIAKALDLQYIAKNIYNQDVYPTNQFPAESPYYDASITQPALDLTGGQQLIDAYVAKTGKDVNITYTNIAGSALFQQLAETVKAQLEKLNHVHVTIESLAGTAYVAKLRSGGIQLGQNQIAGVEPGFFDALHTGGGSNFNKYSSPTVDSALDRSRSALDSASYIAAIKDANKQVTKDLPWIALKLTNAQMIFQDKMNGLTIFSDGTPRYDLLWTAK